VSRWHWTNYGRDKLCLVGCLGSEPRLALSWNRHAWGRGVGSVPRLCIVYPGFFLYNWGKSRKTSVRIAERRSADQRWTQFVQSTWPSRVMASTGLLALAALGFRVRRRGQPSVSVSICRVAVLRGSPHQLTLSHSSQSGLWCGRYSDSRWNWQTFTQIGTWQWLYFSWPSVRQSAIFVTFIIAITTNVLYSTLEQWNRNC